MTLARVLDERTFFVTSSTFASGRKQLRAIVYYGTVIFIRDAHETALITAARIRARCRLVRGDRGVTARGYNSEGSVFRGRRGRRGRKCGCNSRDARTVRGEPYKDNKEGPDHRDTLACTCIRVYRLRHVVYGPRRPTSSTVSQQITRASSSNGERIRARACARVHVCMNGSKR